ncbi:MAG TPA: GIY-YIG nuclease family protein [Candidatus Angelobacter sp.]|jgi:putative endonuclease|nr:GIY-YIG nuclease family protein [Candidatus Angelobacter sp.]
MNKSSYVYMMGSASRRALYAGACASLYERVWQHKNDQGGYFTSKYKCHRLVYYQQFENIQSAFDREDQIKGWRREKKDRLVETMNPGWKDLAADWYPEGLLLNGEPFPKKE